MARSPIHKLPPEIMNGCFSQPFAYAQLDIERVDDHGGGCHYQYKESEIKALKLVNKEFQQLTESDIGSEGKVIVLVTSNASFHPSHSPVPCVTIKPQQIALESHRQGVVCEINLTVRGEGAGHATQHAILTFSMFKKWLKFLAVKQCGGSGPVYDLVVVWRSVNWRRQAAFSKALETVAHVENILRFRTMQVISSVREQINGKLCATEESDTRLQLAAHLVEHIKADEEQERASRARDEQTVINFGTIDKTNVTRIVENLDEMVKYHTDLVGMILRQGLEFMRTRPCNIINIFDDFRKQCESLLVSIAPADIPISIKEELRALYLAASWNLSQVLDAHQHDYYGHENETGICTNRLCWCVCAEILHLDQDTLYNRGIPPPGLGVTRQISWEMQFVHILNEGLEATNGIGSTIKIGEVMEELEVLFNEVLELGGGSPAAQTLMSRITGGQQELRAARVEMRVWAERKAKQEADVGADGEMEQGAESGTTERCEGLICKDDEDPERDVLNILRERMPDTKICRLMSLSSGYLELSDVTALPDTGLTELNFLAGAD